MGADEIASSNIFSFAGRGWKVRSSSQTTNKNKCIFWVVLSRNSAGDDAVILVPLACEILAAPPTRTPRMPRATSTGTLLWFLLQIL